MTPFEEFAASIHLTHFRDPDMAKAAARAGWQAGAEAALKALIDRGFIDEWRYADKARAEIADILDAKES